MSIPWDRRKHSQTMPDFMQCVTLVVKDEVGRRLATTMRKTDNLQALLEFYYHTMAPTVEHGSGVLEYRGAQIMFPKRQKPVEFDMKDGDIIDFVPAVKPQTLVTLVLEERHGELRSFARSMRRTDRVKDLMDFYVRTAIKAGPVFEFDGRRLVGDETPTDLHLEDGAVIHVSLPFQR